ncbi:hypothetical protein BEWA_029200 [Theileria equi strain WA]|uniref:Peptidase S54 rhomboid domain-containing protein n=1 Tax=Theileria equi strain WA TaxID=1537102 RepID=L0AWY6_THEEQ|nr:hypothetical protein BEWA_029200 [Theileria equi strain WA]AFZ80070.1 hypothetical protein BEWA_029200 [Theileria equi strain WA]|eukprot:XP_004829736.1 hypothetical protein BEWA_029200 [Theileria equi strain WA]
MSVHRSRGVSSTLDEFISNIFSSFWGTNETTQKGKKYGRVTTNDIFNVMVLSSIVSSFGHVYFYRTPVLGASGAISGLTYLLAATFPNSFFRTVFPLPGLNLSILQVCQLFVATNVYFLMTGGSRGIAWAAHLMGMGAGALYCWFQQNVNKRPGFYNPVVLSLKTAKQQWKRTFKTFGRF